MAYKNIEDQRKAQREFYKNNREKVLASNNRWRNQNQDRYKNAIKDWRKRNPRKTWGYTLKSKYGISLEIYETLLKYQEGVCAICKRKNSRKKTLCVDHDHRNRSVRGLLCDECNICLGLVKDNPELLTKMHSYLKKWNRIKI